MHCLFISGFIASAVTRAVCFTLLHSLWQGMIAAVVAGLIILVTRRSKAVWRYNLLSIVFAGFVIASVVTFLTQPGMLDHATQSGNTLNVASPLPADVPVVNAGGYWLPRLEKQGFFRPLIFFGNKYAGIISGIWAVFFCFNFCRMMAGVQYTRRLRREGAGAVPSLWKEKLVSLSSLLGINKKVLLAASGRITIPVVLGCIKPVILVPLGMFAKLSPEQVETVLVHELAHIRRNDFAVNLLQRLGEAVFFFNPFILWLSSLIREEREACCDDIVLEYTTDKKSYLEALVSFREIEFTEQRYAVALGNSMSLLARAKRIITNKNKNLNTMEKITLAIAVIAVTAFGFMSPQKKLPAANKQVTAKLIALDQQPSDTVPAKRQSFSNITVNVHDDGKNKTCTVTAITTDGKKYVYTMKNGVVKELSVDEMKVSKEHFAEYDEIINEIERGRKEQVEDASVQKENDEQLLREKSELQEQQSKLQDEYEKKAEAISRQAQEIAEKNLESVKVLEEKAQADNALAQEQFSGQKELQLEKLQELLKREQVNIQLKNELLLQNAQDLQHSTDVEKQAELQQQLQLKLQNEITTNIKLQNDIVLKKEMLALNKSRLILQKQAAMGNLGHLNQSLPSFSNDVIADIISDLSEGGIDVDRNKLSFTLTNDKLVVNGKRQDNALHEKLKAKYIKNKKDHYIYKSDGHSTSTDINNE